MLRSPDCEVGESVKVGESCTLARKRYSRAGVLVEKGGLHSEVRQVLRKRGRACKENLPREVGESMNH